MANHPLGKNLLVIGACGGVGRAFLRTLLGERERMEKLLLVDKKEPWADDGSASFRELKGEFIKASVDVDKGPEDYLRLLKTYRIDIVIDLSVNETRAMLAASDRAGVSYINTGVANRPGENFSEVVLDLVHRKTASWNAAHVLCSGMNPGVVNMWVGKAIAASGVPKNIVHFEYDTGEPVAGGMPIIAWSRETLLRPIMNLRVYPRGFLLLHEENITLGQKYDVPSRFLFSLKTETMDYLEKVYDRKKEIPLDTLALGDNGKIPLKGEATVGVCLEYENTREYFFNTTPQGEVPGVSGSCRQVAAGLHAAFRTVVEDPLEKRVHFVEDLLGTTCERLMLNNLPMQHVVLLKK
jgi:hypothetical protein